MEKGRAPQRHALHLPRSFQANFQERRLRAITWERKRSPLLFATKCLYTFGSLDLWLTLVCCWTSLEARLVLFSRFFSFALALLSARPRPNLCFSTKFFFLDFFFTSVRLRLYTQDRPKPSVATHCISLETAPLPA